MPSGFRGVILALGLIALAVAFGLGSYVTALNHPKEQRYQPYRYAADKPQEVDPSASIKGASGFEYRAPCHRPKGKDESDLCAQWKAARAAESGALWAERGFWLSVVSIIGLGIALWFNLEAWQQAKSGQADTAKALSHAEESAKAMRNVATVLETQSKIVAKTAETNDRIAVMQERAVRTQLRAYLSVLIGGAIFQDSRLKFEAKPQIVNSGHTPASNVRWRIMAEILPNPLPPDFKFSCPPKRIGSTIIGPGQNAFMSHVIDQRVDDAEVSRIKAGDGYALYVWGYISYGDFLGKSHRTTFAQQLYWQPSGPMGEDGSVPEGVYGFYLNKHNRAN